MRNSFLQYVWFKVKTKKCYLSKNSFVLYQFKFKTRLILTLTFNLVALLCLQTFSIVHTDVTKNKSFFKKSTIVGKRMGKKDYNQDVLEGRIHGFGTSAHKQVKTKKCYLSKNFLRLQFLHSDTKFQKLYHYFCSENKIIPKK